MSDFKNAADHLLGELVNHSTGYFGINWTEYRRTFAALMREAIDEFMTREILQGVRLSRRHFIFTCMEKGINGEYYPSPVKIPSLIGAQPTLDLRLSATCLQLKPKA